MPSSNTNIPSVLHQLLHSRKRKRSIDQQPSSSEDPNNNNRISRRKKQLMYYKKCFREDPPPRRLTSLIRDVESMGSNCESLLMSSRLMQVAWMWQMQKSYEQYQTMQSPLFDLLMKQMKDSKRKIQLEEFRRDQLELQNDQLTQDYRQERQLRLQQEKTLCQEVKAYKEKYHSLKTKYMKAYKRQKNTATDTIIPMDSPSIASTKTSRKSHLKSPPSYSYSKTPPSNRNQNQNSNPHEKENEMPQPRQQQQQQPQRHQEESENSLNPQPRQQQQQQPQQQPQRHQEESENLLNETEPPSIFGKEPPPPTSTTARPVNDNTTSAMMIGFQTAGTASKISVTEESLQQATALFSKVASYPPPRLKQQKPKTEDSKLPAVTITTPGKSISSIQLSQQSENLLHEEEEEEVPKLPQTLDSPNDIQEASQVTFLKGRTQFGEAILPPSLSFICRPCNPKQSTTNNPTKTSAGGARRVTMSPQKLPLQNNNNNKKLYCTGYKPNLYRPSNKSNATLQTTPLPQPPTKKISPVVSAPKPARSKSSKPPPLGWISKARHEDDFMDNEIPTASKTNPYIRKSLPGCNHSAIDKDSHRYEQVIRNQSDRATMQRHDCPDCGQFLDAVLEGDGEKYWSRHDLMCTSRHRTRYTPPETPDNFWELSFTDEVRKRELEQQIDQHTYQQKAELDAAVQQQSDFESQYKYHKDEI